MKDRVLERVETTTIGDLLHSRGIDLTHAEVGCHHASRLFDVAGQRVVLFRRQTVRREAELLLSKPFHLAWCDALAGVASSRHTARHTYTTRRDGRFQMTLEGADGGSSAVHIPLKPCRVCLATIDYQGYQNATAVRKEAIRADFKLDEFFGAYPLREQCAETLVCEVAAAPQEYPPDWAAISRIARESTHWTCRVCGVHCHAMKALLHTHHVNGIKTDSRPENLHALCMTCHGTMPGHQTMYVSPEHRLALDALRKEQAIVCE